MASLVLGPMQRYTDGRRATIWVETDAPCEVEVVGHGGGAGTFRSSTRTLAVHGHHYALVVVDGLQPGTTHPYTVNLDGVTVWGGQPGDVTEGAAAGLPTSRIRTEGGTEPLRLVLGSCRMSLGESVQERRSHGVDALRVYARRMAERPVQEWPNVLLLLGDQVYADEPPPSMVEHIRARREADEPPGLELADFAEYTQLYRLAWTDPTIRWLFSTVPTAMVFDDHDIRDDWNTSRTWREQMARTPWWPRRIVGGLGAYWLYQHWGNLSPDELAVDPVLGQLRGCAARGEDGGAALDRFFADVDADPACYRWSYARDFRRARLVMVDSRCGRVLDPSGRLIVDAEEWAWVEEQAETTSDHLLLGTSLPYLLPRGIHDVEAWNEAVSAGAWGRRFATLGERIRQGLDLEHWAAFGLSFKAMAGLLRRVVSRPDPPATVVVLSGDVHYSYLAAARLRGVPVGAPPVAQVVCSPIRNPLGRVMRYTNAAAQIGLARLVGRLLARSAGVSDPDADPGVAWSLTKGPWFANAVASITLGDRTARVRWEGAAGRDEGDADELEPLGELVLGGGLPGKPLYRRSLVRRWRARRPGGVGRRASAHSR